MLETATEVNTPDDLGLAFVQTPPPGPVVPLPSV
jgi:hypothetical protein